MKAYCLLRSQPWYRAEAFARGLRAIGREVVLGEPGRIALGDLVVVWNRYGRWHETACRAEAAGAVVLCAENGYLGRGGVSPKFSVYPKGPAPGDYYSLSLRFHNGRGTWPSGGPERFEALGVELKPWRTVGKHILVCPNRSFGVDTQVMRNDWALWRRETLKKITKREVRVRAHPGNEPPTKPLAEDLKDAWAVYVWSSSVAVHSLLAGIPTFIEAPFHVLKGASASGDVENPTLPDRLPHFVRMSWHQWRLREIESGEAFKTVLACVEKEKAPRMEPLSTVEPAKPCHI